MYSHSAVAVDKGLGFDFSAISDLVKTALPVGLNIFQNKMQLEQMKSGQYMQYGQQPVYPGYIPPSSGMDTTTMLLVGAAVLVVGVVAYKALK